MINYCGHTTLNVQGEEIKIFAPLLACQNSKMADLIVNHKKIDREVTITGSKMFINYLSYSVIDINDENVADIIVASSYFNVPDLLSESKQYLYALLLFTLFRYFLQHQSPNTILRLLDSENEVFISKFQSIVDNFNFSQIISNNVFLMLNDNYIKEMKLSTFIFILEEDNLVIPNEDYLADKILSFVSYHQEVQSKITEFLLKYVDWNKTSMKFEDYINKNKVNVDPNQITNTNSNLNHRLMNYPVEINSSDEYINVIEDVKRKYRNYEYSDINEYEERVLLNIPLEAMLLCENEDCNRIGLFIHSIIFIYI